MVGMRRTDVFRMPPAAAPALPVDPNAPVHERNLARDVVAVLQACSAYIAGSHQFMKETQMKIAELSGKIDTLIDAAKEVKRQQGVPASTSTPAVQPDDPMVQELADRIDAAVKLLKGEDTSFSMPSANSGVGAEPAPTPGNINPATGLPPPPSPVTDPNAPAV